MANITDEKINQYMKEVSNLKSRFINEYKRDDKQATQILRQMRILHGKAIYDNEIDILNINQKK